jgi:hypothetical protein
MGWREVGWGGVWGGVRIDGMAFGWMDGDG